MSEFRRFTPRELELRASLEGTGVAVHTEEHPWGPEAESPHPDFLPVVALWGESEVPTVDEISRLRELARIQIERGLQSGQLQASDVEGVTARGVDMAVLFKRPGGWSYRRFTWQVGPVWTQPASLEEASAHI